MIEAIDNNLEHVLCGLILLGRLGDVVSTYLVTPSLRLEANLLAKKLGWRFALLTLLVCLVPYYSASLGVVVLVPSLLVSASNVGKIWFVRAMGEKEFAAMVQGLARKGKRSHAILCTIVSSLFTVLAGLVLWYLAPDPNADWGYWFAMGIVLYGVAMLVHGTLYYWRLFSKAQQAGELHGAGQTERSDIHG